MGSKQRGTLAGALRIERMIGVTDDVPPHPLDLLLISDPERAGYEMACHYRETLSVAIAKIGELQQTVDRLRATIAFMREEMRSRRTAA